MKRNTQKIQKTNVLSSSDLERFGGAVKHIRQAWENMADETDFEEREMFVEMASKILYLRGKLSELDKSNDMVN
ncbi:MAG: hypothetical protein KBC00_03305 [Candidatus Levybacteria bacterium]|nr:hypothetical protein [Candidatus Levybacteria bacterium]MBP9814906.1 hypothetical protein [Candidatus Levybacteria bacterium]